MKKQHWMKFYPADWRSDPALRSCSLAARGLWMEMLALMHEATPYGELRINGQPVPDDRLAMLCGVTQEAVIAALYELEIAGVFSRTKGGVIFSRRMKKDENRRRILQENGKMGGNPSLCKTTTIQVLDNQADKQPVITQKLEASIPSVSKDTSGPEGLPEPEVQKSPEAKVYARCRELYGSASGGMTTRLLKVRGGNVTLAMADLDISTTKADGKEWLWGLIRHHDTPNAPRPKKPIPYDKVDGLTGGYVGADQSGVAPGFYMSVAM